MRRLLAIVPALLFATIAHAQNWTNPGDTPGGLPNGFLNGKLVYGGLQPQAMGTSGSVNPSIQLYAQGAAASFGEIRQSTPGGGGAQFVMGASNGVPSQGLYSAITSGNGLGTLAFVGDTGSNLNGNGGQIQAQGTGTWSTSSSPGKITIATTASGSTTPTTAVTFDSVQNSTFTGQIISTYGTPTIASGACGTGTNGTITGTNQAGIITIGASATASCAVSFSATLATAPSSCIFAPGNAAAAATGTTVARIGTPTTGGFTISGTALASTVYSYICL